MYADLGHFVGCDGANALYRNANCLKIAIYEGKWIAMSVYTGYAGGFKCVGITATTDSTLRDMGKQAVKDIITEDIGLIEDFYWCECDGVVEHMYKKFGGFEIPSVYAHCFLKNKTSRPTPIKGDPYGYYRMFADNSWRRKVIFGFNSKETYDLVMKDNMLKALNILDDTKFETLNESESEVERKLKIAKNVIDCFYELRYDEGWYDLPDNAIAALEQSVWYIKQHIEDNTCPPFMLFDMKYAIDYGEEIIDSSTKLELHKFNED